MKIQPRVRILTRQALPVIITGSVDSMPNHLLRLSPKLRQKKPLGIRSSWATEHQIELQRS
jgi:hypothetical protein